MATKNSINNATEFLVTDPGSSGDSFTQYSINGTAEFIIGVDDTDDDAFKVSQGGTLGTNDCLTITAEGEVRYPLTPAVAAAISNNSNVTGDSTEYTLNWANEIFDQGGDLSGTTFTAPIGGRYRIRFGVLFGGVTSSHTDGFLKIITSNRTYRSWMLNYGIARVGGTSGQVNVGSVNVLADLDASDTVTCTVTVSNSTKVVDVIGAITDPRGGFFCALVC